MCRRSSNRAPTQPWSARPANGVPCTSRPRSSLTVGNSDLAGHPGHRHAPRRSGAGRRGLRRRGTNLDGTHRALGSFRGTDRRCRVLDHPQPRTGAGGRRDPVLGRADVRQRRILGGDAWAEVPLLRRNPTSVPVSRSHPRSVSEDTKQSGRHTACEGSDQHTHHTRRRCLLTRGGFYVGVDLELETNTLTSRHPTAPPWPRCSGS